MCGIFGYLGSTKDVENICDIVDEKFIKKQFEKGRRRGPENSQFIKKQFNDKTLFMGFHRLAINDLEPTGNQPFYIDGVYLICNGEIYNQGKHNFKMQSRSDCEIIIHFYRKYGIEYLFELLDGVFSFILFDETISKIFVARDPYGVRPLYYYFSTRMMVFASELKQLSVFGTNIKHFEPGSYLTIDNNNSTFKKYHSFGFSKMIFNNKFDIYGIIYQGLYNAVKKRVSTTDRPIACLLSGGLDSSIITALVKKFVPNLETYSIGLEGSTDLKYAQLVADHLGTKHTSIVLTEDQFFDAIPEVIEAISSYDTTTVRASVGNYLIGKYISENSEAKVIFNGDGSDELTGGYLYFNQCPDETEFDLECKRLLKDIHYFDVLRSDRSISSHGLEPRTPFLDRSFVQIYLSILSEIRCHNLSNLPEKFLLRASIEFMDRNLLPIEVLSRTKEAFSDGVSSLERSWYTIIAEKVPITECNHYFHNSPITQEQKYYRSIFEKYYPQLGEIVPYFWMPKWSKTTDPSARTL